MHRIESLKTRQMLATFTIAAVVGMIASGCGSSGKQATASSATTAATTSPTPIAAAVLDTSAYKVSVSGVEVSSSPPLTATASSQRPQQVPDFLTANNPGVNVSFENNQQPSSPLTLTFDFRGKPPPAAAGQIPAVLAVAEGAPASEVLASHWDPTSQTLTAQTSHLSAFFPVMLDLKRFGDQITHGLNGYLGLSSAKPGCVGQPLTVDNTTYTLDPPTVPAAWPCLSRNGDKVSADLSSNSPMGWIVRSQPATTDQAADLAPDISNVADQVAYHTIFAASVGNGTFLLPGGTTHLRFDKTNPPREVGLRADPGATLLNGLLLGLHALYPDSKVLNLAGMLDCLKPFAGGQNGSSSTDIGASTKVLINCVTSGTSGLSTSKAANPLDWATNIATKSVGAVLSLGPDVANQLAASVGGFVGELTGQNTETITVRASTRTNPAPSGPATLNLSTVGLEAGGGFMIGPNHYKFSPKSHDKQGYYVDLSYKWTINRPPGSDLGYCRGHITVTDSSGATVFHQDDDNFNACEGGGGWGAHIKVRNSGIYTVTADIEMERGPTLHGAVQFTVDPL